MKKIFAAATLCLALLVMLSYVLAEAGNVPFDIEIKDRVFVNQMTDIYLNVDDYVGKVIKFEGYFGIAEKSTWTEYSVYRPGPACCADDVNLGLEVIWHGEYPEEKEWVEAIGVFERYKRSEYNRYRLKLSSLTVVQKKS